MKRLLSICLLTLTGCGTSTPDVPVGPGPVRILPMVTRVTGTNFDPEDRIGNNGNGHLCGEPGAALRRKFRLELGPALV